MTRKILIVEDEEAVLGLLAEIFGEPGQYEVACARDGEEALAMAMAGRPDVVLLDVLLPKLDGLQVCRSLKAHPATSHARVLMMSGLAQRSDFQNAYDAGADDYLPKPFASTTLVERVENLLKDGHEG